MSKTSHLIQFLNGNDYVIGMILPKDSAISHKSHDTHRRHIRHIQCSISNDVHKTDRQIPIKTYPPPMAKMTYCKLVRRTGRGSRTLHRSDMRLAHTGLHSHTGTHWLHTPTPAMPSLTVTTVSTCTPTSMTYKLVDFLSEIYTSKHSRFVSENSVSFNKLRNNIRHMSATTFMMNACDIVIMQ